MSVTINGTVCRNCWDVDWAKKVQREQTEKHQAEARKAEEAATAPPGSSLSGSNGATRRPVSTGNRQPFSTARSKAQPEAMASSLQGMWQRLLPSRQGVQSTSWLKAVFARVK